MTGLDLCKLFEKRILTHNTLLTARDTVHETIEVLKRVQMIILKPFSFEELIERIKIHFRNQNELTILTLGAIQIDIAKHSVSSNELYVQTNREFDLCAT
jgi:DNA-binding response OmpR family regulator